MLKKITAVFLFILGFSFSAFADNNYFDHCGQILINGVFDVYTSSSNISIEEESIRKSNMKNWLCESVSGSSRRDTGLELQILEYIGFGGSHDSVDSWASEHCHYNSSSSDRYASYDGSWLTNELIRVANQGIIDAWTACVTAQSNGLVCYGEDYGNTVEVVVQTPYTVTNIDIATSNLELLGQEPDRIYSGKYYYTFEKINPEAAAHFTFNGNITQVSTGCSFNVPQKTPMIPMEESVNLYRYFNGTITDHSYITERNDSGMAGYGYSYEVVAFRIMPGPSYPGVTPLYRYFNGDIYDHFYTTTRNDAGYSAYGYKYETLVGYVFTDDQGYGNVIPVYQYWNSIGGDHVYITERNDAGMAGYGYAYEGIVFYAVR